MATTTTDAPTLSSRAVAPTETGSRSPSVPAVRIEMKSLGMVKSPRRMRALAWVLLVALAAAIFGLGFVPWRQTSRGSGRVVAFFPHDRPQPVESPIKGRVVRMGVDIDGRTIVEGARVRKGQLIVELQDNDPEKAQRLREKVDAAEAKTRFADEKVGFYQSQVAEWTNYKTSVVESANKAIAMSQEKLAAAEQDLEAAEADEWQLKIDRDRQRELAQEGIAAPAKSQEAQAKFRKAEAKVLSCRAYVKAQQAELEAKRADMEAKTREATAKIHEAEGKDREARGAHELAKKELAEARVELNQFNQREVMAPRDGVIQTLNAFAGSDQLKEGDLLFTIVPETTERAVELLIDGNDVPLIRNGREVRLQFEGWPTIQISGWPQASFWTFAGEVTLIDPALTKGGKVRILVREVAELPPEAQGLTQQQLVDRGWRWPSDAELRQGSRANGWVLLNEVSVGYELWRQMNGFPPIADTDEGKAGEKDGKESKKPKLPK